MTEKEKIREVIEKRYEYWKEKEFNSHSIESEARMSECKHLLLMVDSLSGEPASETIKKDNENQYRLNKRFNEGEKVYNVWYNPQLGKFLVIDHFYRERYDQYNIMLCASYEEANAFAFCMNKALLSPIKDRKRTLYHLEELKKQDQAMSDKEKIKDWVKNLKSQAGTIPNLGINALDGFQLACDDVIAFIDSIPKESTDEANCIAQNEDLEEEYDNYFKKHEMDIVLNPYTNCKKIAHHFAEWQKNKMKEALQTEYEKGLFDMKEEMMKDACDTKITTDKGSSFPIIKYQLPLTYECKIGDKVKIIVIKED